MRGFFSTGKFLGFFFLRKKIATLEQRRNLHLTKLASSFHLNAICGPIHKNFSEVCKQQILYAKIVSWWTKKCFCEQIIFKWSKNVLDCSCIKLHRVTKIKIEARLDISNHGCLKLTAKPYAGSLPKYSSEPSRPEKHSIVFFCKLRSR